jgi:hypothetical protein
MRREVVRKVGLWILTIALIAAHIFFRSQAHASELHWKSVQARSGDCQIAFPVMPQMVQQKLKVDQDGSEMHYDVYLAPYSEHAICLLLVAQYPKPLTPGSETLGLEGLLKGILNQHPDNKLVFAKLVNFEGYPAINFLVQSGEHFFRGHAVMANNKLFMIAIEGAQKHFEESIFQKFLKSFHLQNP